MRELPQSMGSVYVNGATLTLALTPGSRLLTKESPGDRSVGMLKQPLEQDTQAVQQSLWGEAQVSVCLKGTSETNPIAGIM